MLYVITTMSKTKVYMMIILKFTIYLPFSSCIFNGCSQCETCLKYFSACLKFTMPSSKHGGHLRESTL